MAVLYQMGHTQWLGPDELFYHQGRQLRALFSHAVRTVPFYRDRFAAAGIDPAAEVTWETLRRLPVLARAELQAAGDALNTTDLPKSHGKLSRIERSEEHTSELQSLMRISYAGFCLKKNKT